MIIVDSTGKEIDNLDFGNVEVGKSKQLNLFLQNNSEAELIEIEILTNNSEVEVPTVPKTMKANSKVEISFIWKPSMKEKKGLKTEVYIKSQALWRS